MAILKKLLRSWKDHLDCQRGEAFSPVSVITDTDMKEQGALLSVWPSICLLLCKFHVKQCWVNNHKKRKLAGARDLENTELEETDLAKPVPGSEKNEMAFWWKVVRKKMRVMETLLLDTVTHNAVTAVISNIRTYLNEITKSRVAAHAAEAGRKHIAYIKRNWMMVSMWESWSKYGRLAVSRLLNIPVEGAIPTTNHLESFNGVLKQKYLDHWTHSGRRL
ncbi:hypothetical protein V5O48_013338 [Marasmius crinis-equi]|uniref:MULE transposase domain-containing protein n=1 Tax=Marasmius crinis-equi TaxID=585013 RepID=A0ABR3F0R7_9AGAR